MKNKPFIVLIIILLQLVISCRTPKIEAVMLKDLPHTYRNGNLDSLSIGNLQWQHFYTDPLLHQLIDSAVLRNNNLLVAVKNVEASQLQLTKSKWVNIPTLNAELTGTYTHFSDNSLNGLSTSSFLEQNHLEDYTTQGILSWEADIWGKLKNQKRKALAEYIQTDEVKKAMQTSIVANVAKGYYNLLMLDAQLEVARKNLELRERTKTIINLQYESGIGTSLAKKQTEALRLQAAQLIIELDQKISIQENAMSILTGAFPSSIERGKLNELQPPGEETQTGVPATLLQKRPDILAAEFNLRTAHADVGITRASLYPSLRITAAGGINAFIRSNWWNVPGSLFGMAAASVGQPILNGRQLKTKYKTAIIEKEKAAFLFRQKVLEAVQEVSDALVSIEKLKLQKQIIADRELALNEAVGDADLLFKNGVATYLEVITAQSNILQSQLDLVAVKKYQMEASVELYRALGGGWK